MKETNSNRRQVYEPRPSLGELEQRLGHRFQDRQHLRQALTHASLVEQVPGQNNERLEFLGDAVLKLAVTEVLLDLHPAAQEGLLSRLRSYFVSDKHLALLAQGLELDVFLKVGRSFNESTKQGIQPTMLANCLEAIFGAVYADAGYACASTVIQGLLRPSIEEVSRDPALLEDTVGFLLQDFKTHLQEVISRQLGQFPVYEDVSEPHLPPGRGFRVCVRLGPIVLGQGQGRSKKAAGQLAAREALAALSSDEAFAQLREKLQAVAADTGEQRGRT